MARLTALPSLDIIHGFRGILDFYLWKGLPCVRRWPRMTKAQQSDATKAASALFGDISQGYSLLGDGPLQAFQADAADHTRTARDIYMTAVYGHLHERTIPEPPPPPEEEMYDAYVFLRDLKPITTDGGTFTSGAWRTRDLNDEQADAQDICALAANRLTLAPGSYRCLISVPAMRVDRHQARLFNVTAGAVLLLGTSQRTYTTYYQFTRSVIVGRFTVAAGQALEVQHYCNVTRATYGFGRASHFADEIYTIAEFWRESVPE